MQPNLGVGGVSADVVDPPRDLEVEDGVECVFAAVDNVRSQLQLLPAADDVRAFAAMFMRSFIQYVIADWEVIFLRLVDLEVDLSLECPLPIYVLFIPVKSHWGEMESVINFIPPNAP